MRIGRENFEGSFDVDYRGRGYLSRVALDVSSSARRIIQAVDPMALRQFRQQGMEVCPPADMTEGLMLSHAAGQTTADVPLAQVHLCTRRRGKDTKQTFLGALPVRIERPEQLFDMIRSAIEHILHI